MLTANIMGDFISMKLIFSIDRGCYVEHSRLAEIAFSSSGNTGATAGNSDFQVIFFVVLLSNSIFVCCLSVKCIMAINTAVSQCDVAVDVIRHIQRNILLCFGHKERIGNGWKLK